MDVHPALTSFVYVALIVVALLVIAYWYLYTHRLKTSARVGRNEGIAMATQRKERTGRTGTF